MAEPSPLQPYAADEITELSALYEISTIPTSLVSLDELANLGVDKATRLLRSRLGLLYRWAGRGDGSPRLWAVRGMPGRDAPDPLPDRPELAEAFEGGRPVAIVGAQRCAELTLIPATYRARHALLTPCGRVGGARALLITFRLTGPPYSHVDVALFGVLGDRIGAALETLRLFDEMTLRQEELEREIAERKRAEEERERLIAELQETLATIKTLSGLLPICAWCKRIRTDKGYWTALEEYLREHTDIVLTHGICPACAKELSAELNERQ